MGRGKSWSREESEAVAKAWKQASEHTVSLREQNSKAFVSELYQRFIDLAPSDPDALEGRWTSRSQTAVKTQFDAIADDLLKFNVALNSVRDQMYRRNVKVRNEIVLRAAIGMHVGAIVGNVDFDSVDAVETDWKLYGAWHILKSSQRFCPINWPLPKSTAHGQGHVETSDGGPSSLVPHTSPMETGNNSGYSIPSPGNYQSSGNPLHTLASAAPSINIMPNGLPSLSSLPHGSPTAHHMERNSSHPVGSGRRSGVGRTIGKRRADEDLAERGASKSQRTGGGERFSPNSGALELVAQALGTLGDALSEYNALTLFSREDMEGRADQKAFFSAMAEKHVLKAKLDRDKVVSEVRQKNENNEASNSFSD